MRAKSKRPNRFYQLNRHLYTQNYLTQSRKKYSAVFLRLNFSLSVLFPQRVIMGRVLMDDDQFNSFSAGTDKQANTSYCSIAMTHLHPLSRGSIVSITRFEGASLLNGIPAP